LQIAQRRLHRRNKWLHRVVRRLCAQKRARVLEIGCDGASAVARQFAADEIKRLKDEIETRDWADELERAN